MIDRIGLARAEHGIGKGLPFADRHRGELHPVGHIAHGMDVIDIGAAEGIDHDLAALADLDPDRFEAETFDVGNPASGDHDAVEFAHVLPGQLDQQRAVGLPVDIFELGEEQEFDALGERDLHQPVTHRRIIAAQDRVRTVGDRHLAAEFVEDAGEFICDIAPARNQDAARQGIEMERLVRSDDMLVARKFGDQRARAGGDQDVLRRHHLAARQRDLVIAGDGRALVEDSDVVVRQRLAVEPFQPGDVVLHQIAQPLPVEALGRDVPPELACVFKILGEMRAVDQHLLGHAAPDHAGAADPVFLGHRHPCAVRGSHAAGTHAARAGADGEKVKVEFFGHARSSSCRWKRAMAQAGADSNRYEIPS